MIENILYVDDEENLLRSFERVFLDVPANVITCASAEEAMRIIKTTEIAVIVSDNMMPGITGLEFLSWAKSVSPDSVRILMTGFADLSTAIAAINQGEVYKFITKPWEPDELVSIVMDSINKYRVILSLRTDDEAKLISLAQTIELKDPYTKGHCERVALYATQIAKAMGLNEETKKNIKYGSWLHDCGKIGVPEAILNQPTKLDHDQFEIVKRHSKWGAEVVQKAQLPETVVKIALHHHEKFNGNGYPCGLAGNDIPVEARIVAIADAFDALTTNRPYRHKLSEGEAFAILLGEKNISFDPVLVDIFITTMTEKIKRVNHG
jgi:putative nucleotidyltransferase with HDIG domain